eukprot:1791815-Rhodomonas_salina.3
MLKLGGSGGDGWIRFPELDAMDWDELWSTKTAREQWRDEVACPGESACRSQLASRLVFDAGEHAARVR